MSGKNKSAYPFFIITGSLLCLVALSLVNNSFSFRNLTFRPLDLLAELRPDPAPVAAATPPARITHASHDSISRAPGAPTDTAKGQPLMSPPDPDHLHNFMTYTGIMEYAAPAGDTIAGGMQHFLQALGQLKQGKRRKVRIAYFGDSMIEGDLITEDLRDSLQTAFGGAGVGFVPVTSVVAPYRATIRHTFSDNWKDYHFRNNPPENILLGLSGHTFIPGPDSWIRYSPVRKRRLNRFSEVSLLYGPCAGNTISVNDQPYQLGGAAPVNTLSWRQDSSQPAVTIKWNGGEAPPLYGVCFEDGNGVYVDNYSFRGISGIELGRLSRKLLAQMQQQHPYDLVVLHYGANVLWRPELTDYSWYERPMQKVMDSLRSNLPSTSFLVIGTADKSYRKSDRYVTAPGVPALLKVQHGLAQEHGTGYWNLYAAMGGEGSMARWVEGDTVLANKDYTHFNRQGAARVGALLYKAIMDEYRQFGQP